MQMIEKDPDETTLKDIVLLLFRNKLTISLITGLFTIGAVVIACTMEPTFTSKSVFFTKIGGSGTSQYAQLASLAGINLGGAAKTVDPSDYLDKVMQDEQFLKKILDQKWYVKGDSLLLDDLWKLKIDTALPNWKFMYAKKKIEKLRRGGYLSLSKNMKTSLLTLTTNFQGPECARDVNLFILQQFQRYLATNRKSQAKDKCAFILERIGEVKQSLQDAENHLTEFREKNAMSTAPRVQIEEMRLLRQVTINQEIYLQLQKQYELARIDELDDQPLIEVVQKAEIPHLRSKPKRKNILIMGFILGLFTSVSLIAGQQWYKRVFKA